MIPTALTEDWGSVPRDRVGGAIFRAAQATGVDFDYLLGQAKIESGLNPTAKARTSSATGLFQFIEQTWLGTVKEHGAKHGLGWAADAIQRGSNGRFHVAGGLRQTVLDLRTQPEAASAMAAEFASDNKDYLESRLGRPVEGVDLYLAHFLGAGGAREFLGAHDANPDAPAAGILPAAARANRWVFYNRDGSPRSFAEIRARFAAKLGVDEMPVARPAVAPVREQPEFPTVQMAALNTAPEPLTRPSPQYARLAYLMLAQLGA
ncbi:transglycosylase SLT domain-containing protein [Allosphingosinicella sp.]|uniref:transglycosylase SLT domain-containing protein n=1 Tax=Allosphingosinicella sp. TaxID=2823234 RepID=UPI002FC257DF